MSRLLLPRVPRPEVSVLMVTYGGRKFVEKALRALKEGTPPVYELVLVDNASPDGLAEWLKRDVKNATRAFNDTNRGFGPGNNQAASLARGRVLVLLNSDAFVHPGWLPPLLEALEGPRVATAGPRILNVDGTLQEAGCLLFSDGTTEFVGYQADPAAPEFAFPRDVDYSSGSCLAIPRSLFFEAGGFDPEFAPAYYEDLDLCLRLRSAGWRCVYEPRSVVTHVRGASTTSERARAVSDRNAARFRARWGALLGARPAWRLPGGDSDVRRRAAARDALADTRVLVIAGGVSPRVSGLLEALAERRPACVTTLLSLDAPPPASAASWLARGLEVVEGSEPAAWLASRRLHYDAVLLCGSAAKGELAEAVARTQPQALLAVDAGAEPGGPSERLAALGRADAVIAPDEEEARLLSRLLPHAAAASWSAPFAETLAALGVSPTA